MNAPKSHRAPLVANALFSTVCSLVLLTAHAQLGQFMGLAGSKILFIIGLGLLPFIGLLLFTAFKQEAHYKLIMSIVIQDWLWVAGSAVLIIFNPFDVRPIGLVLIAVVALFVAMFAILQRRSIPRQT